MLAKSSARGPSRAPLSQTAPLGTGSTGERRAGPSRNFLSRPGECCAERSPGFLHADLIGREGTLGEQARRRGVLLPENPTLRGRSSDKICNPWRSVVGNDARRSSESAGRRRGSRVLRAILSYRELPERDTDPATRSIPRFLPKLFGRAVMPGCIHRYHRHQHHRHHR